MCNTKQYYQNLKFMNYKSHTRLESSTFVASSKSKILDALPNICNMNGLRFIK